MPDPAMWDMIHDMRERVVRLEERLASEASARAKDAAKLDKLVTIAERAEGAAWAGRVFGRSGYAFLGAAGALVISQWQNIKRLF